MTAYIGVGSNVHPVRNIKKAFSELAGFCRIVAASTFYITEPLRGRKQPDYYNGVWAVETDIEPRSLKQKLRNIEEMLGRRRLADKYASRPIDLDIVLYGDLVLCEDDIEIPDSHIAERPFLAVPIKEINPKMILPGSDVTISDIAGSMDTSGMKKAKSLSNYLKRRLNRE